MAEIKYKKGSTKPFETGTRLMEAEQISEKKPRSRSGKRFVTTRSKKTGQLKTKNVTKQLNKSEKTVNINKLKKLGKKLVKGSGQAMLAAGVLDYILEDVPMESFRNRKEMLRGKIKPTIEKIKGTPKETKNKKHGGKITYRMNGGQVIDSSYD